MLLSLTAIQRGNYPSEVESQKSIPGLRVKTQNRSSSSFSIAIWSNPLPDLGSISLRLIYSYQIMRASLSVYPFLASLRRVGNLLIVELQFIYKKMIYALIEYGILTVVCVYLVNYYSSKEVSMHVRVWSVITWVLNFGLALLVPEDVYQTLKGQPDQDVNQQLGLQYLLLYWLVYLLTWTIIPVLQEWEDAGDLESNARMKRSLKINGIFYLVLIVIAIVALIIMIFLDVGGEMGLIVFLKCLATIWGMLLLMVLLGYALVQIPKTMWRNATPNDYLAYLYQKVNQMEQQVDSAKKQFKMVVAYIKYVRKNSQDPQIIRYCNASESLVPANLDAIYKSNFQTVLKNTGYLNDYPISLESSIEHNRLIKRSIARCRRQEKGLSDYVKQAVFYEDVKKSLETGERLKSVAKRTNSYQEMWYCKIRSIFNKVFAILIGLCCLVLLISQTQVFLTKQSSILSYLLHFDSLQVIRVIVFFVMGFIIYMSNYALFRLKLANLYGLYQKESDGASLMFATVNFSRIGVAIVLNFFDMVKMKNSIYLKVMQAPAMGLLGQWVLKGLPGILWLIVICHFFNFWGWLSKKLGFQDSYSFSSHQIKNDSERQTSPYLVQQKRRELQQKKSENLLQEMDNF